MFRPDRRTAMALSLAALSASPLRAQSQGPVRIVAGFAAGGSSDAMARLIAERLEAALGRRIIVENKPGAGGRIAAEEVSNAVPDGSVLLLANTSMMVLAPVTFSDIRYDASRDFAPVARLADFQVALATGPLTAARTLADLMAFARANPDKATYGVPAAGSLPHLTGLAFAAASGVPMQAVVFQGGAPIAQAMAGGHLAMGLGASADYAAQHQGNALRIVAMTGTRRHPSLPDVPTFAEAGVKGLEDTAWSGLFLPKGAAPALVEGLRAAVQSILASPDVTARLEAQAFFVNYGGPAEVSRQIVEEQIRWRPLVEKAGLRR